MHFLNKSVARADREINADFYAVETAEIQRYVWILFIRQVSASIHVWISFVLVGDQNTSVNVGFLRGEKEMLSLKGLCRPSGHMTHCNLGSAIFM